MNFSFLPKFLPYFTDGTVVTISVSILVVFFGTIIGILLALAKLSNFAPLKWLANIYIGLFRGTPMILQIMVFFVTVKMTFLPTFPLGILNVDLARVVPGIIILSMNSGAYVAEIIRGGILSVPKGQIEAAHSLGIRPGQTMRSVVLPQAIRNCLPSLGNEFVTIIKDSSLLSTIGVMELYNGGLTTASTTYITLEPLLFAGLFYLVITLLTSQLINLLEKKMSKGYVK
ncbi:amino acid ABC transporter permease [Streptococcaceae bacterium ESL0687]|nr:amino acid ABC transporter permease [Streptococcaceae bacterium ESL0687]